MTLPVIGAALKVEEIDFFRDWLFEKDRDIEIQSFETPEILIGENWRPLVEAAKEKLAGWKGRLGIHGPYMGLTLASHDPEIRAVARKRMMRGLEICEALGATQMVIHSPYTTWNHFNLDMMEGKRDTLIAEVHDTLDGVVTRAENSGVMLVLENIEDVNPQERKTLAESFDSDMVQLSIDTGHAAIAHNAPPVDYFVRSAGEQLHHIHLQDVDGYADRHWAVGQGNIPWQAVFDAIGQLEQKPRLILEMMRADSIQPSMAYLEAHGLGQ
ncbi:MAG: TIM barrel protein [Pelagimonas sp.]